MEDQETSNATAAHISTSLNDNVPSLEYQPTNDGAQTQRSLAVAGLGEIVRTASSAGATINLNYNPQFFADNRQTHTHEYHTEGAYKPQFVGGDLINQPSNQQPTDPSVLPSEAAAPRNEQIAGPSSLPIEGADRNNEPIAVTPSLPTESTTRVKEPIAPRKHPRPRPYPRGHPRYRRRDKSALEKFSRLQQKYKEPNVMLLGLETSQENIPIVHPKMVEASVVKRTSTKHEPYIPSTEKCEDVKYKNENNFENLIKKTKEFSFWTLIGHPGKSTKPRHLFEENYSSCFLLKFMDMKDDQLTLRQLLLNKKYSGLSKRESELIFEWIVEHDNNVSLYLKDMTSVSG